MASFAKTFLREIVLHCARFSLSLSHGNDRPQDFRDGRCPETAFQVRGTGHHHHLVGVALQCRGPHFHRAGGGGDGHLRPRAHVPDHDAHPSVRHAGGRGRLLAHLHRPRHEGQGAGGTHPRHVGRAHVADMGRHHDAEHGLPAAAPAPVRRQRADDALRRHLPADHHPRQRAEQLHVQLRQHHPRRRIPQEKHEHHALRRGL